RVADDLANKRLVLGDIWDVDGKRKYLDGLEREGVLPSAQHALSGRSISAAAAKVQKTSAVAARKPNKRRTLIPQVDYGLPWPGRLQRHRQIWDELQFHLTLTEHPNAISVLFRVLLELAMENYIAQAGVTINDGDKLAARQVGKHLRGAGKIDDKQLGVLTKFQHSDQLVSADTLNRYVHSPSFAPSPEHLASMWDSLADVICLCLQA
ncbi:MAG: hypothetical protein QMD99_09870, partial [Rhizobiaceae bacterium]|nr:hypothetical protein [Rhizobiaceae bacterium]